MQGKAFKILGIEPTYDRRAIRAAFVRLARIYHPDRFIGVPDDVRAEAERRMKDATAAYEELMAAKRLAEAAARSTKPASKRARDPWQETRRAREAIAARRAEQERNRSRWLLWEELERQARERADFEAQLATLLIEDLDGQSSRPDPAPAKPNPGGRSALTRRLEEARGPRNDSITPLRGSSQ